MINDPETSNLLGIANTESRRTQINESITQPINQTINQHANHSIAK